MMVASAIEIENKGKNQQQASSFVGAAVRSSNITFSGLMLHLRGLEAVWPVFRGNMEDLEKDIESLIAALESSPDQRRQAQVRLVALGERAVEPLMEAVAAEKGQKAWAAAEVLGELANPRAFQVLVTALYAKNPMLGGTALKGLLNYEGRDILPYLILAFPRVHIMTQQNMILALQRLGDRRAVKMLIEQLGDCTSSSIRMCIIQALGKLGDPAAIPAVRARLNDNNQHVREWAAIALKQLELNMA